MSLIESSSSITSNFYCSYGFAKTNIEWEKPNFKKIKLYFLELLNKTNIFKKYKVIIVGKSLYNINATTDIDLHLIGNEKDYIPEELENDFSLLYNKAFEKQILVDICFKEKEEPKILNLSSLNLTEFELLNYTKNNFRIRPAYFKKIKNNSNYIMNNIKCPLPNSIPYSKWLWKYADTYLCNKIVLRVLKNPNENLINSLDVLSYIEMTEEEFKQKTNHYKNIIL